MLSLLFKSLIASFLLFSVVGATQDATATDKKQILVYGDSLSAAYGIQEEDGWVSLLAQKVVDTFENWEVVNASVSGETTVGGLNRLPVELDYYNPEIVLIELGPNDGLRGYPLSAIRTNLEAIVAKIVDFGATPVIIGMQLPPNYGDFYTNEFFKLFKTLSESSGLPFIPFLLEGIGDRKELMQPDGLHPTAEAQPLILETVWPTITSLLEGDRPLALQATN